MEDEIVVESEPLPQSRSQPPSSFQTLDQPPERQFSPEEETLNQGMQEPQEVEEEEEDEDPQDMDFWPAGKKWKPPPTGRRRDTAQEKLGFLMNNLQPVPFASWKTRLRSGKRAINETADVDDVNDGHFPLGDHQKRMRVDAPQDHTLSALETCLDQVQAWMGKAKMAYAQKEQAVTSAQLQLQYLSGMLQQKDNLIQSMEKSRLEEQCKWQLSIYQFERELSVMAQIIQGYKKALLKTRHSFAEYRKKFPQGDEPLYKDDYDVGRGTLLTTRELERKHLAKVKELEKKQLVKEDANRCMQQMMDDFERKCFDELGGHAIRVYKSEKGLKELMGKCSLQKKERG